MRKAMSRLTAALLCLLLCAPTALAAVDLPVIGQDYKVSLNGTRYVSLNAAVAAAEDGDELTLLKTTTERCEINKRLTIWRNGHEASQLSAGAGYVLETDDEAYRVSILTFLGAYCQEGERCLVSVEYYPGYDGITEANGSFVVACYNDAGQMLAATVKPVDFSEPAAVFLNMIVQDEVETVKLFVMSSSCAPLLENMELEYDASLAAMGPPMA